MDSTPLPAHLRSGGFWRRLLAQLADGWLLMVVVQLPLILLLGGAWLSPAQPPSWGQLLWSQGFPVAFVLFFWMRWGATPGKMALDLRIADEETLGPPSRGQLIGRFFAYILSALPLGLGFLWAAWDPRKQAWHDKLSGTRVLVEREIPPPPALSRPPHPPPAFLPPAPPSWALLPADRPPPPLPPLASDGGLATVEPDPASSAAPVRAAESLPETPAAPPPVPGNP